MIITGEHKHTEDFSNSQFQLDNKYFLDLLPNYPNNLFINVSHMTRICVGK